MPLRPWLGPAVLAGVVAFVGAVVMVAMPDRAPIAAGAVVAAIALGALAVARAVASGRSQTQALAHVIVQAERVTRGEAISYDVPAAAPALESLDKVAAHLKQMTDARVRIVATERDLDRVRRMYRSILPLTSVASHGALRIAGACMPAADTGGDWWTYRKLSGGRTLVVVGDATGHGVYSAMIGCAAHGAVEALSHVGEDRLSPASVLKAIDAAVRIPGADQVAMTCFAALFDPSKRLVEFANASHTFPLVVNTDATGAVVECGTLTGDALAEDFHDQDSDLNAVGKIRSGSSSLSPGDLVILFTDGVTERQNKNGRTYGARRLQHAIQAHHLAAGDAGVAAVRDAILANLAAFADHAAPEDDVTLVVCALERA